MTKETVNNPAHYGGADDPFETIKVLEARLTPAEFMGFCKGNAYKYNDRARSKGRIEDFKKSQWYQARLIAFGERIGADVLFAEPSGPTDEIFWDAEGNEGSLSELIGAARVLRPAAIHSNVAPHTRWAVSFFGEAT